MLPYRPEVKLDSADASGPPGGYERASGLFRQIRVLDLASGEDNLISFPSRSTQFAPTPSGVRHHPAPFTYTSLSRPTR